VVSGKKKLGLVYIKRSEFSISTFNNGELEKHTKKEENGEFYTESVFDKIDVVLKNK